MDIEGRRESDNVDIAPPTWISEEPWRFTADAMYLQRLLGIDRDTALHLARKLVPLYQSQNYVGEDGSVVAYDYGDPIEMDYYSRASGEPANNDWLMKHLRYMADDYMGMYE